MCSYVLWHPGCMTTNMTLKIKRVFSPTSLVLALYVFMLLLDLIVLSLSVWIYWFDSVSRGYLHFQTQMVFNSLRDWLGVLNARLMVLGQHRHARFTLSPPYNIIHNCLHGIYFIRTQQHLTQSHVDTFGEGCVRRKKSCKYEKRYGILPSRSVEYLQLVWAHRHTENMSNLSSITIANDYIWFGSW